MLYLQICNYTLFYNVIKNFLTAENCKKIIRPTELGRGDKTWWPIEGFQLCNDLTSGER